MKHFLDFKMILLPRDSVDNLTGRLHQYRLLQSCQSLWQDNRISRKILSCRLKDINLSKTIIFFCVLWGFRGKEARLCETFYVTSCSSRELECALVNFKYGDLRASCHTSKGRALPQAADVGRLAAITFIDFSKTFDSPAATAGNPPPHPLSHWQLVPTASPPCRVASRLPPVGILLARAANPPSTNRSVVQFTTTNQEKVFRVFKIGFLTSLPVFLLLNSPPSKMIWYPPFQPINMLRNSKQW